MSTETELESLTEHTFADALAAHHGLLVDFWAPWCGPCRAIAPMLEALAREAPAGVLVAKVNVDQQPALAARFGVTGIPTLLFFREGVLVDTLVGAVPRSQIAERLEKLAG